MQQIKKESGNNIHFEYENWSIQIFDENKPLGIIIQNNLLLMT